MSNVQTTLCRPPAQMPAPPSPSAPAAKAPAGQTVSTSRAVASHPKVLSGDDLPIAERPDAEIENFGDSGIDILIEFWMEGIDDGDNRVGGDLLLMIWMALKANDIEIPFPQREIKVLGRDTASGSDNLPRD